MIHIFNAPLRAVLVVCAGIGASACARPNLIPLVDRPPEPITVFRELAYAHPIDEVRRAYRLALEERGLILEPDSNGVVRATVGSDSPPGVVRVTFGPSDTLATRIRISYRYRPTDGDNYHFPYNIPILAAKHLDRSRAIVAFHQGIHPATLARCPEAAIDTTATIEEPRLAKGSGVFASRTLYTDEARSAGVQGVVYLGALVNESGSVDCIEVLSGLPHGLTASAIRTLSQTAFIPARQRGQPIRRRIILPVRFKLE